MTLGAGQDDPMDDDEDLYLERNNNKLYFIPCFPLVILSQGIHTLGIYTL